jgi:hypothetical protein
MSKAMNVAGVVSLVEFAQTTMLAFLAGSTAPLGRSGDR